MSDDIRQNFHSAILESLPNISDEDMKEWAKNPTKLQSSLASIFARKPKSAILTDKPSAPPPPSPLDYVVRVDRTATIHSFIESTEEKREEYNLLNDVEVSSFDPSRLTLDEEYAYLESSGKLRRCPGYYDLLAIERKGENFFDEFFGNVGCVLFMNALFRHPQNGLYVMGLHRDFNPYSKKHVNETLTPFGGAGGGLMNNKFFSFDLHGKLVDHGHRLLMFRE